MNKKQIFYWGLRLLAAVIMLQTLYFKFTAAPESVYIFSTLGMEPWGRIATGFAELVAGILLLVPSTVIWGAMLGAGIMLGAVASHFLFLGISVQGDGGQLFIYALLVLTSCVILLYLNRQRLFFMKPKLVK